MNMPEETRKITSVVLDALSEFILYIDPQMRIQWANRAALEATGLDLDGQKEPRCFELWHQRNEPCPGCPVVRVLETGQAQQGEVTSPEKKRWFVRAYPTLDDKGNAIGVVEIATDITERSRLTEELRQSEEVYRTLVETSPDAIALLDLEGNIIKANRQAALLVGINGKQGLAGKHSLDFDPQTETENFSNHTEILQQLDGSEIVEYEVLKSDGTKITTETRSAFVFDTEGTPKAITVVTRDVTERKQAERALQESEAKYTTLVEQANEAIFIVQDGVIKFVNKAAIEAFGYAEEELLGKPYLDMQPPESREEIKQKYTTHLSSETSPRLYQAQAVHKDGRTLSFEVSVASIQYEGQPAVLGVARDTTERQQAEKALRESEAKYAALVENAQDAIVIMQDGFCKYINQAAREIYGYTLEELQEIPFIELVAPESRESVVERYQSYFSGKERAPRLHHAVVIHKDGTRRNVESTGAIIEYQGNPAVLGIFRDVTDRTKAEDALKESEAKYSAVVQSSRDALAIIQDGIIKFVNSSIEFSGTRPKRLSTPPSLKKSHPSAGTK